MTAKIIDDAVVSAVQIQFHIFQRSEMVVRITVGKDHIAVGSYPAAA